MKIHMQKKEANEMKIKEIDEFTKKNFSSQLPCFAFTIKIQTVVQ